MIRKGRVGESEVLSRLSVRLMGPEERGEFDRRLEACQQESARYVTQEIGGDYLFGLKGNQSGIRDRAERLLAQQAFPPEDTVGWEKHHNRLERRRGVRVAVTPEQIGRVGCWQVLRVRRERIPLGQSPQERSVEDGYYVTSKPFAETTNKELGGGGTRPLGGDRERSSLPAGATKSRLPQITRHSKSIVYGIADCQPLSEHIFLYRFLPG